MTIPVHVFEGELAPGRSAASVSRFAPRIFFSVTVPLMVSTLVLLVGFKSGHGSTAFAVFLTAFLLSGLAVTGVTYVWLPIRSKAEQTRGYTTLRGENLQLPQLLDGTKYIVREANEAAIDGNTYVQRGHELEEATGQGLGVPAAARVVRVPPVWFVTTIFILGMLISALIKLW